MFKCVVNGAIVAMPCNFFQEIHLDSSTGMEVQKQNVSVRADVIGQASNDDVGMTEMDGSSIITKEEPPDQVC